MIILLMIIHSLKKESVAEIDDHNQIKSCFRLRKVQMDACGLLEYPGNLFFYLTRGQVQ